jgi:tRNA-modifying protein YgfZ
MKLYKKSLNLFKVNGKDGLDLINRISTNDCLQVKQNQTVSTILLDDKGKIVDILYLFLFKDELFMFMHFANTTLTWIDRFVFTEDISFEKQSYHIYEELSFKDERLKNSIQIDGDKLISIVNFQQRTIHIDLSGLLSENVSESEYNDYRIEHLLADFNHEILEKTIPLELGFIEAVSFTKGCYIGQEVIARLESMHKVSKYLGLLRSNEAMELSINQVLQSESGNPVGRISSTSSDQKSFLAIIHKSKIEKGSELFIENNTNALYVDTVITDKTYQKI